MKVEVVKFTSEGKVVTHLTSKTVVTTNMDMGTLYTLKHETCINSFTILRIGTCYIHVTFLNMSLKLFQIALSSTFM